MFDLSIRKDNYFERYPQNILLQRLFHEKESFLQIRKTVDNINMKLYLYIHQLD